MYLIAQSLLAIYEVYYAQNFCWHVNDCQLSGTSELNIILESDPYEIQQVVSNIFSEIGYNTNNVVNSIPISPFAVLCGNVLSTNGDGILTWYMNDTEVIGETSNELTNTESGMYGVSVTNNGCISEIVSGSYQYTSINQELISGVSVYPNPVCNSVVVDIENIALSSNILVKNQLGKIVLVLTKPHSG